MTAGAGAGVRGQMTRLVQMASSYRSICVYRSSARGRLDGSAASNRFGLREETRTQRWKEIEDWRVGICMAGWQMGLMIP